MFSNEGQRSSTSATNEYLNLVVFVYFCSKYHRNSAFSYRELQHLPYLLLLIFVHKLFHLYRLELTAYQWRRDFKHKKIL